MLKKKQENFSQAQPFFCMSCMKCLSKCFSSKKPVLPRKIPGCTPVTSNLTFYPNFHPNIWVFANLPIYSKLIHGNISLKFWKPKTFCLVLFWRRYKIVCTYKHLHWKLWLVLFWRRYVLFLYWHYNLCYCYFEENKIYHYFHLFAFLQYSERI